MSVEIVPPATAVAVAIAKYSEKAGVVFGEGTRNIKEKLSAVGCRFNPKLTIHGVKTAGWIFPWAQRSAVEAVAGISTSDVDNVKTDGGPSLAVPATSAVGPSVIPSADPSPVTIYTAPDGSFIVVGPTYSKREALKSNGGEWLSGWRFPGAARLAVEAVLVADTASESAADGSKARVSGKKRERGSVVSPVLPVDSKAS
jgi:hypothetical protein